MSIISKIISFHSSKLNNTGCLVFYEIHTDGNNILHTLLLKHYTDLLERQSSEWGKDEVSYFYVGDVLAETSGKSIKWKLIFMSLKCFSNKVRKLSARL